MLQFDRQNPASELPSWPLLRDFRPVALWDPEHDHSALRLPRWWKGGGRRGWNDVSGGENGRRRRRFVFLWPSVAYTIHPVHKAGLHCCLSEASWSLLLENLLTSPHNWWHHTAVSSSASGNMSGFKRCHYSGDVIRLSEFFSSLSSLKIKYRISGRNPSLLFQHDLKKDDMVMQMFGKTFWEKYEKLSTIALLAQML